MTTIDAELVPGARNAVRTCLAVRAGERVTLITDRACRAIADALAHEIAEVGASHRLFVLEDIAPRPLTGLPPAIAADLEQSTVSIFAARVQTHELGSRIQMTDIVNRRRIRHAHMVNITDRIMREGMRADFCEIDRLSTLVHDRLARARTIRATTPAGTDLVATFDQALRWIKTSGIISPEKWGNLPGGEVFTTPADVAGTYVIDGVVGDWLCDRYGLLDRTPLIVRIAGGRLVEAESANRALRDDFWAYTHTDENSDRVGEFAMGTNTAVQTVIGHILQDEKVPGVHIAFGNPYGAHTRAAWFSSTHIDVVATGFTVWVDDEMIMRDGRYLLS